MEEKTIGVKEITAHVNDTLGKEYTPADIRRNLRGLMEKPEGGWKFSSLEDEAVAKLLERLKGAPAKAPRKPRAPKEAKTEAKTEVPATSPQEVPEDLDELLELDL